MGDSGEGGETEVTNRTTGDEESQRRDALSEIALLPSCPLEARHLLPRTSAIYFLMKGLECMYVGQSINLHTRWRAHERLLDVDGATGWRVAWRPVPEALLDKVEREMVASLRPPLNGNLLPIVRAAVLPSAMNLLSTSDAAQRLGVSPRRILALIEAGKLIAQKVGRDYAIEEKALAAVTVYGKPGRPPNSSKKKGGKK